MDPLCNDFLSTAGLTSSTIFSKPRHIWNAFKPILAAGYAVISKQCGSWSTHSSTEFEQKLSWSRKLLMEEEAKDPMESLIILDAIQRLGIGYHFQEEIHEILSRHSSIICGCSSLHDVSISFRLLRQQGFLVSPDVFNNFKGEDERFKEELRQDIRGLLQLYEATQLSFEGEDILEEAKVFSINVLCEYCSSSQATPEWCNEICMRLKHPYHKSITGLTRMHYQDNMGILSCKQGNAFRELVQADFCTKQSIFKDELLQVSRWWNGLGLVKELKLARNQPVKWYTWSMMALINHIGLSEQRIQLTKSLAFIYVIDDIFDLYGTLDELAIFTKAVEIWDHVAIDMLPNYMKKCYKALLDTTQQISNQIHKMYGHNPMSYLRETWANLCNAFLVEARWLATNDLPGAYEYLDNAKMSSGVQVALVHLFFLLGLGKCHENEIHLEDVSILISSVATILRLWDDLGSAKDEHQDGRDGSYITCYMKDDPHASLEQVQKNVSDQIEIEWKHLNLECFRLCNSTGSLFAEASLNLTRMVSAMYGYDDNQRLPILEDYIKSMLNDQMSYD